MKRFKRYWLPALLWTGLVLLAGSDAMSARNTGGLFALLGSVVGLKMELERLALINFYLRKSAHVIEYGTLSILWFRALRAEASGWKFRWAGLAFALAALTAAADEFHQTLTADRTGSIQDVYLDMKGALAAQALVLLAILLFRHRRCLPAPGAATAAAETINDR